MPEQREVTGGSIREAVEEAVHQLGLGHEDVEVEVLEEPRRGLFGSGRPAKVRVTAKAAVAADDETQATHAADPGARPEEEQEPMTDIDSTVGTAQPEEDISPEERMNQLDEEADLAADFVEGLLDLLDLPGDIEIQVQDDQALVNLEDVGSGLLIGRRGATLDALQELVRCAVQRQTERRSRVRIDVEGYRSRHVDKLRDRCREAIAQVRESGEAVRLEPMDAYERKLIHDLVARTGGVTSSSEGTEPRRRVVLHPES